VKKSKNNKNVNLELKNCKTYLKEKYIKYVYDTSVYHICKPSAKNRTWYGFQALDQSVFINLI